jgi:hypothetical protein
MKRKASIFLIVVFVSVLAGVLVNALQSEAPIQVLGDLSKREVADIRGAVRHYRHPPILSDLSVQSILAAPGLVLRRLGDSRLKVWTMEARTHGFVAVTARPLPGGQGQPYFWAVFRETNGWQVGGEY